MNTGVICRSVVLDAEALSSIAAGRNTKVMALIQGTWDIDARVLFPTIILSEIITGKPSDASVWRIANKVTSVDLTVRIAVQAGRLRARAGNVRKKKKDLTVDAIVASTAILWAPSLLITGDADDLCLLTEGSGVKVVSV